MVPSNGIAVIDGAEDNVEVQRQFQGQAQTPNNSQAALPDALATTLDHIVGQLEIITRTMGVLEQRLVQTENRVSQVASSVQSQSAE
jgi:hypothetical protein